MTFLLLQPRARGGGGASWPDVEDLELITDFPGPSIFGNPITSRTGTTGFDVVPGVSANSTYALIRKYSEDVYFMFYCINPLVQLDAGDVLFTIPENLRPQENRTFLMFQPSGGAPIFRAELWAGTGEIKTQWGIQSNVQLYYIGFVTLSTLEGTPTRGFQIGPPGPPLPPPVRFSAAAQLWTLAFNTDFSFFAPSVIGGLRPFVYSVENLPAFVNFDTATGRFYGTTPGTGSVTTVTVTVTDALNESASARVVIQVR